MTKKSINLHDKIEELCSKYPINKCSMSDKELSAYHQGVYLGATKIAEYLSEQRSIELSEEEIIKTIKTEISQIGTTAYENYTHDSSDKEYWTYMTCKKITNLINSLHSCNESIKKCKDCWHNYHCPMPQEGYDFNPDACPYNPDKREKL